MWLYTIVLQEGVHTEERVDMMPIIHERSTRSKGMPAPAARHGPSIREIGTRPHPARFARASCDRHCRWCSRRLRSG